MCKVLKTESPSLSTWINPILAKKEQEEIINQLSKLSGKILKGLNVPLVG